MRSIFFTSLVPGLLGFLFLVTSGTAEAAHQPDLSCSIKQTYSVRITETCYSVHDRNSSRFYDNPSYYPNNTAFKTYSDPYLPYDYSLKNTPYTIPQPIVPYQTAPIPQSVIPYPTVPTYPGVTVSPLLASGYPMPPIAPMHYPLPAPYPQPYPFPQPYPWPTNPTIDCLCRIQQPISIYQPPVYDHWLRSMYYQDDYRSLDLFPLTMTLSPNSLSPYPYY